MYRSNLLQYLIKLYHKIRTFKKEFYDFLYLKVELLNRVKIGNYRRNMIYLNLRNILKMREFK